MVKKRTNNGEQTLIHCFVSIFNLKFRFMQAMLYPSLCFFLQCKPHFHAEKFVYFFIFLFLMIGNILLTRCILYFQNDLLQNIPEKKFPRL